jgi:hypothetical protein
MPLQQTSGNVTADAYGGGVAAVPNYIEDVFSTWLYDGTGSPFTITNGIDLAGKGGLVWTKARNRAEAQGGVHGLIDTVRGNRSVIYSNYANAQDTAPNDTYGITGFNSTGYGVGINYSFNINDTSFGATNYVSWTFRKQPKFFDVVTYSGSNSDQTISHNLGSAPGCIMIKKLDSNLFNAGWAVYHRSLANPNNNYLVLNTTAATENYGGPFISSVSSTTFTVAGGAGQISLAGSTYVAYLFAHDAGGFGLTGTDNVISCGSFTADGSGNANVTLGYEPQWVLIKNITVTDSWYLTDTMRGMPVTPTTTGPFLIPNTSAAESSWGSVNGVNATGWNTTGLFSGRTYIYIAIRRGPMKVPTDATKVFSPVARTGTGANATINAGFTPDMILERDRFVVASNLYGTFDRLRGPLQSMSTNSDAAESSYANSLTSFDMSGVSVNIDNSGIINYNAASYINWFFQRAPSFFDEVCYTGNNTNNRVLNHNLGVAPQLVIIKARTSNFFNDWSVTDSMLPVSGGVYQETLLNARGPFNAGGFRVNIPSGGLTSTTVTLGPDYSYGNYSPNTYVMYLFATCPGVSKVFLFTGNGTTQTINCGFAGGARFVLLKAASAYGDWFVYDTARGMTTLTDPYLWLNSYASETATLGSVTTVTTGFAVNEAITTGVNTNGVTYIGLAIA